MDSNEVWFRKKYHKFIADNIDSDSAIDKIFTFAKRYGMFVSNNVNDQESGILSKKRIIYVSIIKLALLITCGRFLISALTEDEWVEVIMSDANGLLGNKRPISLIWGMSAVCALLIELVIQFQEMSKRLPLLKFFNDYKRRRITPLNAQNTRRWSLIAGLMTKYMLKQVFWPMVILTSIPFIGVTFVAYSDENSGFYIVSVLFFSLCHFVFLIQLYVVVCFGFIAWTICTLYLKYKFIEIYSQIEMSLKFRANPMLFRAIADHNYIEIQTKEMNEFFCLMIFILYYFASPTLILNIVVFNSKDTYIYLRYVFVLIFFMIFSSVFFVNLFSSQISHSAKRPISLCYKHLIRGNLSKRQRFKTMAFIEKLDGPDIGFYCWDLFPMNNFEFYLFVANCVKSYLLILTLFS